MGCARCERAPPHLKTPEEIEHDCVPGLVEVLRTEGIEVVRYAPWDMTGRHRDYDPCVWRSSVPEWLAAGEIEARPGGAIQWAMERSQYPSEGLRAREAGPFQDEVALRRLWGTMFP